MKCIQFTDPHVGLEGQNTFDVDVRANFIKTLDAIAAEEADHIVLTGDLCFREPQPEIYQWISDRISERNLNVVHVAGNHDDQQMMRDALGCDLEESGEIFFSRKWSGRDIVFLDTALGSMSEQQWTWLEHKYDNSAGPLIVFMHHPPAICGVPYMDDQHAFHENERFQKLVQQQDFPVHIFCGHYHVERTLSIGQMHVYITPSNFFQISAAGPEFEVDHYRIGYRRIILTDTSIISTVVYLN